jgi:hypothetical protein
MARRVTGGINSAAGGASAAACSCLFAVGAHRRGRRALAAGRTWTRRTANAQWAGRYAHTSLIDAAGAIYVIGGWRSGGGDDGTHYQDVWVSTDGGVRPDNLGGGWVLGGVRRGYSGVLQGYYVVLKAY